MSKYISNCDSKYMNIMCIYIMKLIQIIQCLYLPAFGCFWPYIVYHGYCFILYIYSNMNL